jgi:hypothetical protein
MAAAALALAGALAVPAAAELEPGVRAPALKVKEVVNTTSVDVQTLKGRVVLLEIFRTW